MRIHISYLDGYIFWELYDENGNGLSRSAPFNKHNLKPSISSDIERFLKTVGATKRPTFSYENTHLARIIGTALGGKEEAKRGVLQTKDRKRRQRESEKKRWAKNRAKKWANRFWLIVIMAVIVWIVANG